MPTLEQPRRHPLCKCTLGPDGDPTPNSRCGYHSVGYAEDEAMRAAIETHMSKVLGLDPEAIENDEIRNQIGIMLTPALDAYLGALIATPGWTLADARAYLKAHPNG